MKRNFRKRFRGLFLAVSLAACGCGNYVVESKGFKNGIAKLVLTIALGLVINVKSEGMIKEFIEDKIDEFSKNALEKLDKDKQKNNQKEKKEKKERVYEKVARIFKNYLAEMAEYNGSYKKIVWKAFLNSTQIKEFQNMKNKNLGTANIIWCVLSLKYYEKFDSEKAQKDERIQNDLLKIINDIIDVVINAISGKIDNEILKKCIKGALTGLSDPLKKFIKKRAAIDKDWITATSGFLGTITALSDMPPSEKLDWYGSLKMAAKLLDMGSALCNVGRPNVYKFENYTKEDFWKGLEAYY